MAVDSHEAADVEGYTSALDMPEVARARRRWAPRAIEPAPGQRLQDDAIQHLRVFRSDIQDLQATLESVRLGEASLLTYDSYLRRAQSSIDQDINAIDEATRTYSNGAAVRHLHNLWDQMKTCLDLLEPGKDLSAQDQLHHLNMLAVRAREITYQVGVLTIPETLNEWLRRARPGYYVPFHAVFDDEVPDYEDRSKILRYLAWSPETIEGGIVDASTGLIYRYSRNPWNQLLSFTFVALAFLLSTAIVFFAPGWISQLGSQHNFTLAWGAVLAGIIIHVAVGTAKRLQIRTELPAVLAISDIPRMIDAKVGPALMKPLLALFGLFGLTFTAGESQVTLLNAFLVGYSLDSVVELFAAGVEQRATTQVAALKRQLGSS